MNLPVNRAAACVALAILASLLFGPAAQAAGPPAWDTRVIANSTVAPGDEIAYIFNITNAGSGPTSSEPAVLEVDLPPGITAVASAGPSFSSCTAGDGVSPVLGADSLRCSEVLNVRKRNGPAGRIIAKVDPAASGVLTAHFRVSGGGAAAPSETVRAVEVTEKPPAFALTGLDQVSTSSALGGVEAQAGGHPYEVVTNVEFASDDNPDPAFGPPHQVEPVRNAIAQLPAGLVGVPPIASTCRPVELASGGTNGGLVVKPLCPATSQVGVAYLRENGGVFGGATTIILGPIALYRMTTPLGTPAQFGFSVLGSTVLLQAHLRTSGDYGLSVESRNIPSALALVGTELRFWGTPADPSHDRERACPGQYQPGIGGPSVAESGHIEDPSSPNYYAACPDAYTRPALKPFIRQPTTCNGPLPLTMLADTWLHPGTFDSEDEPAAGDPNWKSRTTFSHEGPGFPYPEEDASGRVWGPDVGNVGCDAVPFSPSISVLPTTQQADSPTGLEVDLRMPQQGFDEPEAVSESDLKEVAVALPEGMSINSASATGLGACSPAEVGLKTALGDVPIRFSNRQATCPNSSKVGALQIDTPLLEHPVDGAVYLAKQGDNPFQSPLAIYLVAEDPQSGTVIKLPGRIEADPQSGRLTTVVDEQPQLPFERFHLEFFGGPRATLRTPPSCGTYTSQANLTPWARPGDPVSRQSSFQITSCPNSGFNPKLRAGTESPQAGSFSPFNLVVTREDGMQELSTISVTLPPGLLGSLRGIPYCPDSALAAVSPAEGTGAAQLANPSCPAASQVGRLQTAVGAGAEPFSPPPGGVYLAGPYKGAPLSLAIVAPALAGPFDLGSVLVRTALRVDPTTTQLTAVSDPVPTILHGIPLDLRDVRVEMNRPGFTINPTSCDPMAIASTISSVAGTIARPSDRFQAGGCASLPFKPKLKLSLRGKTRRGGFPRLTARLTMPPGGANLARARVTLPAGEAVENAHIRNPCTRVQFNADACPKSSILGYAKAISPLLEEPLQGPVYFRSNGGERPLPDLVADLRGQIHVVLVGAIDSVKKKGTGVSRLRSTFAAIPDAPVSEFTLNLFGGKRGLIVNQRNLCKSKARALVEFDGHNGKIADSRPKVAMSCSRKKK